MTHISVNPGPFGQPLATIRYEGLFDQEGLFKTAAEWFEQNAYELHERKVKHKVPSPAGMDQENHWEGWVKESDYIKFWVRVAFRFQDLKDVEVVKDGKRQPCANHRQKRQQ